MTDLFTSLSRQRFLTIAEASADTAWLKGGGFGGVAE